MVRLAAIVLFFLAVCQHASARAEPFIEIIPESEEAFLGDTVMVEVRWSGLLDPIDFGQLAGKADVLRETVGTRLAVIGGEVIDISSRRIELEPKQVGPLIVGPLRSGDTVSNTVVIKISKMRPIPWQAGPDDINLKQSVSTAAPLVQQQVVLDIVLTTRFPIAGETVTLPDLRNFRALTIFAERRTLERGVTKVSWRYLLFPQQSGKLSVKGARIGGTITKSRLERARFDLAADATTLDVAPSKFAGANWWIAASSLSMSDAWSGELKALSAGDEIERTITVSAEGVLPEQIPDIAMPETNGLSVVALAANRQVRTDAAGATATAAFQFRVRALSPIPVFLDTVRLRWWNTTTDTAEEAIIPARRVDIGVPDRTKLIQNTVVNLTWLDRMRAALADQTTLLWIAVAISLFSVVFAISQTRLNHRLAASRCRRSLFHAVRTGNSDVLYRALRTAAHASPDDFYLAAAVSMLETEKFGRNPVPSDLVRLAKLATTAHSRGRGAEDTRQLPEV